MMLAFQDFFGDLDDLEVQIKSSYTGPAVNPAVPKALFHARLDPELREICRRAKLGISGRKADLITRIVHAWQQDLPLARNAVQQVLGKAGGGGGGESGGSISSTTGSMVEARPSSSAAAAPTNMWPDPSVRCICVDGNMRKAPPAVHWLCTECGASVHAACLGVGPLAAGSAPAGFTCPSCMAVTLVPFAPGLPELQRPKIRLAPGSSAAVQLGGHGTHMADIEFEYQPSLLAPSSGHRLELRCFLAHQLVEPPKMRKNHRWPLGCVLFLNGTQQQVQQVQQAWDGHSYKDRGEDSPLVLPTHLLRAGTNRLYFTSYDPQPHIVVVLPTTSRTWQSLVAEVRDKHTLLPSAAQAHMRATFGDPADDDDDVVAGASRVSLRCPLSMRRIATPARGVSCRHLECFDLESYIELATATPFPRWQCPLCSMPARPHQLRVDSWTAHVLESLPADATEVEVQPDGAFAHFDVSELAKNGAGSGRKRKRPSEGGDVTGSAGVGRSGVAGSSSSSSSGSGSGSGGAVTAAAAAASLSDGGTSGSSQESTTTDVTVEADKAEVGGSAPAARTVAAVDVIEIDSGDDEDHPICLSSDEDE